MHLCWVISSNLFGKKINLKKRKGGGELKWSKCTIYIPVFFLIQSFSINIQNATDRFRRTSLALNSDHQNCKLKFSSRLCLLDFFKFNFGPYIAWLFTRWLTTNKHTLRTCEAKSQSDYFKVFVYINSNSQCGQKTCFSGHSDVRNVFRLIIW